MQIQKISRVLRALGIDLSRLVNVTFRPGRELPTALLHLIFWTVLALGITGSHAFAQEQYQAQGIGPYGDNPPGPTDRGGCLAGINQLYPTPDNACQALKGELPLCDRSSATYRNYVATLTSPTSCFVSWEYLNTGSTSWGSWSSGFPIYTCPSGWKARPVGMTGCAPVDEENLAQTPQACGSVPKAGNPIYPLTGAKKDSVRTGVQIGGIELTLTYDTSTKVKSSSQDPWFTDPASFGALWKSNFHHRLLVNGSKSALLSRGDGDVLYFSGGSSFTPAGNVAHRLVAVSGGYLFSDVTTGTVEMFDNAGKLTTLTTASGMVLTFAYDSNYLLTGVRASDGRALHFAYTNAVVSRITTPEWETIAAAYDPQGNLSSLTWQDGTAQLFLYENSALPWALTGKVDENGLRLATFGYDTGGRATSTEYAGGVDRYSTTYGAPPVMLVSDLVYDAVNDVWKRSMQWQLPTQTTLMGPTGGNSALDAQLVGGMPHLTSRSQPAGSGCAASTSGQTYDGNGNILSRDDFNGTRTCYAYDGSRRELVRVEGLPNTASCATVTPANASLPAGARKITTTWHADWNFQTEVNQPLQKLTNVYHGQSDPFNGNALASCTTGANRADGKPLPVLCKRVEQALLSDGTMDASVPVRTTTFSYDSAGRLLSTADANNKAVRFGYFGDTVFSGASYDPYIDQVALLLHGNGANNATSIIDDSSAHRAPTLVGNAKISTTQGKFGGSSIAFDGAGDYLSIPYSTDFAFGSGDFTIETFLFKNGNNPNSSRIWNPNGDYYDGINLGIDANGNFAVYASTSGTSWTHSLPVVAALADGQWYHLAVVRSGGSIFAFVNGIGYTVTSALGTTSLFTNASYPRVIGGQAGVDRALNGYVDEFRITKGVARYTTNFTVPTAEFLNNGPTTASTGHSIGDLQTTTNAAGQVTQFKLYDPAGRVRQMADSKGVVTDITYKPRGWVESVTVTPPGLAARTTTYTYDSVGQVTGVTQPDGTSLAYTHDAAHRLVGVRDARGNAVTYTLDNTGNRIAEEVRDPAGTLQRSIARSFDALNRVQQVTGAAQ